MRTGHRKTAVITVVSGRHAHLWHHLAGIAATRPDDHVVVSLGDPEIGRIVGDRAHCVGLPISGPLPLAVARNTGAQTAIERGADLLIFLDVDCVPSPALVATYRAAADQTADERALLCGPVTYLPPPSAQGYDFTAVEPDPHPVRPAPAFGQLRRDARLDLFWSLSFALPATSWNAIGGFDPAYVGYGGEDTDFAATAGSRGFHMCWVGGAHAFHQWHPVSDPPVEHLDDILRNAALFERKWGRWPMSGWLDAFAAAGLAHYDGAARRWVRTADTAHRER